MLQQKNRTISHRFSRKTNSHETTSWIDDLANEQENMTSPVRLMRKASVFGTFYQVFHSLSSFTETSHPYAWI